MAGNRQADLRMMAAEATGEDKAWAINQLRQEFGEEFDAGPSPRFDMRTNTVPALDPMDAAIKRRAAQQQGPMGGGEAFARGVGQGATGGFGDEMVGSSASYGVGGFGLPGLSLSGVRDAAIDRERAGDPTGTKTYEDVRGQERGSNASAAEQRPELYYPGMVLGGVIAPGPKGAPKGAGFGTRLGTSVKTGVGTGVATGIGQSDKEAPEDIAADAGFSGLVGGTIGALGTTLAAPFKWGWDKLAGSAPQRIANEAAEGATQQTTATARKHLANAREGLAEEVISGPRGDEVRAAMRGPAAEAPAKLQPRLDELGGQREAAYGAFEQAGRDVVDPAAYRAGLEAARKASKSPSERAGFKALVSLFDRHAADLAEDGAPMTLKDVRAFTTDIQKQAASTLGGLNEHATAELKNKLSAVASKTMDDMLEAASDGDEGLQAAARSLRESNKGTAPLLTAKKALKQRAHKEASEGSGFRRLGKQAPTPVIAGAIGAASAEDGDRLENMALYGAGGLALSKGLPAIGGLADRALTSGAIYAARHPNSAIPGVLGAGARPFVPPLSLNIMQALLKRREQEDNGRR